MADKDYVIIDGIKWWISADTNGSRFPIPLCPKHHMRLEAITAVVKVGSVIKLKVPTDEANEMRCPEGNHVIKLPRQLGKEKIYVINKIDTIFFKNQKFINLDDEAVPIAESKIKTNDAKYFVTAKVLETKRGPQVVIYAGTTDKSKDKTQVFVEPQVKRMDFDRNDIHPGEIFTEIKATFPDGSSHTIKGTK